MNWFIFLGLFLFAVLMLLPFEPITNITLSQNITFFDRTYTTIAKGFAMLCVMLCHYMGHFGGGVTIFTPLGGTGVAAFLILSGYGMNESWKKHHSTRQCASTIKGRNSLVINRGGVF